LRQPVSSCLHLPPKALLSPRRLDIAVKYRFFAHLLRGGDPDAERVYRWHIEQRSGARMKMGLATDQWKKSTDDYVNSANQLFDAMLNHGFMQYFAVPIDPDQELLDGSHRVACALAFWQETIPVVLCTKRAWAPPWGRDWFVAKGMAQPDLARLESDWNLLTQ
jgi:hypothetical protein